MPKSRPSQNIHKAGLWDELVGQYVDDGCEYSETCLACPLPVCKYDSMDIYKLPMKSLLRHLDVFKCVTETSIQEAAELMGITERTIQRNFKRVYTDAKIIALIS